MKKKFDSKSLFEMILLVVFLFFASLELNDLNNIQDPEIKISDLPIASEVVSDDVADLEEVKETKTIADFKTEETSLLWNIVNDGVMGGISSGEAYVTNES